MMRKIQPRSKVKVLIIILGFACILALWFLPAIIGHLGEQKCREVLSIVNEEMERKYGEGILHSTMSGANNSINVYSLPFSSDHKRLYIRLSWKSSTKKLEKYYKENENKKFIKSPIIKSNNCYGYGYGHLSDEVTVRCYLQNFEYRIYSGDSQNTRDYDTYVRLINEIHPIIEKAIQSYR
jgi:hypothetical protein